MLDERTTFVEALPEDTTQRLRDCVVAAAATDKRKRRQRRGALTTLAFALIASLALGITLTQTKATYASWQAQPTPLDVADEGQPAVDSCLASLRENRPDESAATAARSGLIAEVRGDITATLLRGPSDLALCVVAPRSSHTAWTPTDQNPLSREELVRVVGNGGSLDGDEPRYVYGRVSRDAADVVVTLADGTRVAASVAKGYFLAWWPMATAPSTVSAMAENGKILQTLQLTPASSS